MKLKLEEINKEEYKKKQKEKEQNLAKNGRILILILGILQVVLAVAALAGVSELLAVWVVRLVLTMFLTLFLIQGRRWAKIMTLVLSGVGGAFAIAESLFIIMAEEDYIDQNTTTYFVFFLGYWILTAAFWMANILVLSCSRAVTAVFAERALSDNQKALKASKGR